MEHYEDIFCHTESHTNIRGFLEHDFLLAAPRRDMQVVREVFNKLADRYEEPSRYYHTLSHLYLGLRIYFRLFKRVLEPTLLFPWYYHDSVYDSKASDNEQRSGILWMRDATALGFTPDEAEQGNAYILATNPSAEPLSVINDIDLAGLGAPPEVFDANTVQIRKEYHWVEPEVWRKGRLAILNQILKRDRLYITQPFMDAFEAQARKNLKREIETLIKSEYY